jgi:PIN domain nuclease of toxin-antitoxin system
MKFLLDTHALLWWLADDSQLGRQARELVEDPANDVLVSVVALWEIALKTRIGKLQAITCSLHRPSPRMQRSFPRTGTQLDIPCEW